MSSGHHHTSKRSAAELDALCDEALANPKVKARLARRFKLVTTFDIPYLGSSSIGGARVYLDRHIPPIVLTKSRQPLIRHERLEQACEDELGWRYELSHEVATRWEHRIVPDPKAYEKMLRAFIKADAHEKILNCPTDMDLRPELAPPVSEQLLTRIRWAMAKEKEPHWSSNIDYQTEPNADRQCSKCSMFVTKTYGGPACTLVKDPIEPQGFCRRFSAGKLDG